MPTAHQLLVVKAHPDDESFGHAGLILQCRERGIPVQLVCATRGEAGIDADSLPPGVTDAGIVRLRELAVAREFLGLQRVEVIGVADGLSADWDLDMVRNHILRAMRNFRPTVVITFGPDGVTGHLDHITIGRVTTEAFHELRGEWRENGNLQGGALSRLYHVAVPKEFEQKQPGRFRGRDDITTILDVSKFWEQKREAIRCHASQLKEIDLSDPELRNLFSREYLVREFPPQISGLSETDIFPESDSSIIS